MILSKHRCLGQECRRLLEAAEKGGKSFIPVSEVRRESVSHASRTVCVFRGAECVVVRICGCVCAIVYAYIFFIIMMKNLRRARVRAETRTCGTDSPSKSKSRALSITPPHHLQKKRQVDDRLPAHAIQSTRESSEDVTRTLENVRADLGGKCSQADYLPIGSWENVRAHLGGRCVKSTCNIFR